MLSHMLSRFWWATLLRGAAWILFGVALYARPAMSLLALTFLFGLFALVDGITNTLSALAGKDHESWWMVLIAGVLGMAVGLLTFSFPGITAITLLLFIAIWAIVTGLIEIVQAVQLRREIEGEAWLGLAGLLSVAFGVFLLVRPAAGALAVLWLIASYAIVFGTILVILAFETRTFARRATGA
jgi:uncharacterized membrane protein HdeD (DUF308 family)